MIIPARTPECPYCRKDTTAYYALNDDNETYELYWFCDCLSVKDVGKMFTIDLKFEEGREETRGHNKTE